MTYETDALKRDLERLSLEFHHFRVDRDRDGADIRESKRSIADAQLEIHELTRRLGELEQRASAIEEAMPSSAAELLALASTQVAGLLGVLAHDEQTTVAKLTSIVERLPHRTISTGGDPYLTRWYLWPEGPRDVEDEGSDLPFAVFLHHFHRGDVDRDQHNHPWDLSVSIVLAGGYREERGDETRVVLPGTVNVIRADDFHRVDLLNPGMGSWSLFVAGRKTGGWGFKDKATGAVTPWHTYLASKAMRDAGK